MSLEALWSLSVETHDDRGAGVMVFDTNRLFGGDSAFCWVGTYELNDGTLTGRAQVHRHAEGLPAIFPELGDYDITFSGSVNNIEANEMVIFATIVGAETDGPHLKINFTRVINLP